MALNHNLQNKITEEYIQQRIKEHNDKIYLYIVYDINERAGNLFWKFKQIRADNKRELLIKIFDNEYPYLAYYFFNKNLKNPILADFFDLIQPIQPISNDNDELYEIVNDIEGEFQHDWGVCRDKHPEVEDLIYNFMINIDDYSDYTLHYEKLNQNID